MEDRAELSILGMKNSQTEVFNKACNGDRIQELQENVKTHKLNKKAENWIPAYAGKNDEAQKCRGSQIAARTTSFLFTASPSRGVKCYSIWWKQTIKIGSTKSVSWATWRSASYCVVCMSEVCHCSSQAETHFQRKLYWQLFFEQLSLGQSYTLLCSDINVFPTRFAFKLPYYTNHPTDVPERCLPLACQHTSSFPLLAPPSENMAWNSQLCKPALCDVTKGHLPDKFSKGNGTRCPDYIVVPFKTSGNSNKLEKWSLAWKYTADYSRKQSKEE